MVQAQEQMMIEQLCGEREGTGPLTARWGWVSIATILSAAEDSRVPEPLVYGAYLTGSMQRSRGFLQSL